MKRDPLEESISRGRASGTRMELAAGPLSMIFEPETGWLRTIHAGEHEVLRAIYGAVRDENWRTIPSRVHDIDLRESRDGFALEFAAETVDRAIDFRWRVRIEGEATGRLAFVFDGKAHSDFRRNRIGLCVLHPASAAGARCSVEHADGRRRASRFPVEISPHQPFFEIAAITHDVAPGLRTTVRFAGDIFEMEDQRNWTDASFKTYSTPLALPFPVEVKTGSTVVQRVELQVESDHPLRSSPVPGRGPVVVRRTRRSDVALPRIGLGLTREALPLSAGESSRIRSLRPAHLRFDIAVEAGSDATARATEDLEQAGAAADAIGAPLELALHLGDRAGVALAEIAPAIAALRAGVARLLVFTRGAPATTRASLVLAAAVLERAALRVPVAAGSNAYFTEVNRHRPPIELCDLVAFSLNPQVHAFDDASLVETLATQETVVRSARAFSGDRPIAVTPVTLRPRFNPNATSAGGNLDLAGELPVSVDPRQRTLFTAGWTLGSLRYLALGGAASITYFEAAGARGVIERDAGTPFPGLFDSEPGEVFPVYHVLEDVTELEEATISADLEVTDPLRAEVLFLSIDRRRRVLVANLTPDPLVVRLGVLGTPAGATIRLLDDSTRAVASREPERFRSGEIDEELVGSALELSAYAIARIDWDEES